MYIINIYFFIIFHFSIAVRIFYTVPPRSLEQIVKSVFKIPRYRPRKPPNHLPPKKTPKNPRACISSCDPTTESEPNRNRPVHQRHHPANLSPVARPKAGPVFVRGLVSTFSVSHPRRVASSRFISSTRCVPFTRASIPSVCMFPSAATSDIFSSAVG